MCSEPSQRPWASGGVWGGQSMERMRFCGLNHPFYSWTPWEAQWHFWETLRVSRSYGGIDSGKSGVEWQPCFMLVLTKDCDLGLGTGTYSTESWLCANPNVLQSNQILAQMQSVSPDFSESHSQSIFVCIFTFLFFLKFVCLYRKRYCPSLSFPLPLAPSPSSLRGWNPLLGTFPSWHIKFVPD